MNQRKIEKRINQWKCQKTKLLVIAGRKKAGKDVLVEYILHRCRGFVHYRIAEAPAAIARVLELPPDRKILQKLFELNQLLRPVLKESAYKRRVARMIDRDKPRLAVVEAARTREEYDEFVKKRGGLLIGIVADPKVRYGRALRDARKSDEKRDEGKMSFREFMMRERVAIERDIDWIVGRSDFVIENNYSTRVDFYKDIDKMLFGLGLYKK